MLEFTIFTTTNDCGFWIRKYYNLERKVVQLNAKSTMITFKMEEL